MQTANTIANKATATANSQQLTAKYQLTAK
jgi:hypothetical protein